MLTNHSSTLYCKAIHSIWLRVRFCIWLDCEEPRVGNMYMLRETAVAPTVNATHRVARLSELTLLTIAFVTDRRPSPAVALAVRFNPGVRVLVVTPRAQREQVLALGCSWADIHANVTAAWGGMDVQGAPYSAAYWQFCYRRWLALAIELRARPLPHGSAIAVLDDDVLLFENVEQRLREAAAFHLSASMETVVNGAFVIGAPAVLERFAAFLWQLFTPSTAARETLARISRKYGESRSLGTLSEAQRDRIHPVFRGEHSYMVFTDMQAMDAFRILSRGTDLPSHLRVHWSAGHRRVNCTHGSRLEKLRSLNENSTAPRPIARASLPSSIAPLLGFGRRLLAGASAKKRAARSRSTPRSTPRPRPRSTQREMGARRPAIRFYWQRGMPHLRQHGPPLCFVHLQGPEAKRTYLLPMLEAAGVACGVCL